MPGYLPRKEKRIATLHFLDGFKEFFGIARSVRNGKDLSSWTVFGFIVDRNEVVMYDWKTDTATLQKF